MSAFAAKDAKDPLFENSGEKIRKFAKKVRNRGFKKTKVATYVLKAV